MKRRGVYSALARSSSNLLTMIDLPFPNRFLLYGERRDSDRAQRDEFMELCQRRVRRSLRQRGVRRQGEGRQCRYLRAEFECDSVTLSDEAKAYLEANGNAEPSLATVAANARQFFDQQYAELGIPSAVLDGEIAVDLSGQDRATLSAIASNAQGLFSQDEIDAAAKTQQVRFDDAVGPYVVIARHTGDYAMPYDAALSYLNKAGADERATPAWKDQYQAVLEGRPPRKARSGRRPTPAIPTTPSARCSIGLRRPDRSPAQRPPRMSPRGRGRCSMRRRTPPATTGRS